MYSKVLNADSEAPDMYLETLNGECIAVILVLQYGKR